MATTVSINSSDWVDMRNRGYIRGAIVTNKGRPSVEYSMAADPSTSFGSVPSGGSLTVNGTYLWLRGFGEVEFKTTADVVQEAALVEPAAKVMYNSAVPIVLLPSGVANTAGVITLNSAVLGAKPYAGAMYGYLPAGVVSGDGVGGFYLGQLSTANTVFTVSNASTIAGAYTQITSTITLQTLTIPANELGPNGAVRVSQVYSTGATANAKVVQSKFGGNLFGVNSTLTTTATIGYINTIRNCGAANRQQVLNGASDTGSVNSVSYYAVDTTLAAVITCTCSLSAAAVGANDWAALTGLTVELIPGGR